MTFKHCWKSYVLSIYVGRCITRAVFVGKSGVQFLHKVADSINDTQNVQKGVDYNAHYWYDELFTLRPVHATNSEPSVKV